ASGLNLATYREQDAVTGRWINRDPIREAGGLNLYAYVDSNPINSIDVDGLFTERQCARYGLCSPIPLGIPECSPEADQSPMSPSTPLPVGTPSSPGKRTIPMPPPPGRGCTCSCRADADDTMPGNLVPGLPLWIISTVTAHNCQQATKEAKREAIHLL